MDMVSAETSDSKTPGAAGRRATVFQAAVCLTAGGIWAGVFSFVAPALSARLGAGWMSALAVSGTVVLVGGAACLLLHRSHRLLAGVHKELDEQRSVYRDFFENANDVFYIADRDGVFRLVNPAGKRLTGFDPDLERVNLFELVAPEHLPLVYKMAARKANGTTRTAYELEIITNDGRRIPVEVNTRLVHGDRGVEAGVQGVLRDISERRSAERQLRESEELLTILTENIPEGVVLLDDQYMIVRSNRAALELLNGQGEIVDGRLIRIGGRPTDELLDLPHGSPAAEIEIDEGEFQLIQVSGRRLSGGDFSGGVLVIRDATNERRVAEHAQHHARLAAVGELAAGVAHDFNNLLQGIAAVAEALRGEVAFSAQAKADVETIVDQTIVGSRVTRQLLDFSRQSPLTRRQIDFSSLLQEVCPLLARALPAAITFDFETVNRPVPVLADPALIQQMVANLVINARDAISERGRIVVTLEEPDQTPGARVLPDEVWSGSWIELRVLDDGCGMSSEVRARAFEPFFTTKGRGTGTGLGLSQVYGIVQQHDGQIMLASRPDEGTEVSVFLPVCKPR
jgi:two-component system cell cycle sensor histidine kinase/response regulator CckA